VTLVPAAKPAVHVLPQSMPAGVLVTVPVPVPALVTVSVGLCSVNETVTLLAASIVTVQLPVPAQAPLQPVKVEPVDELGVRVTLVPEVKLVLHVLPQSIPTGLLVTVPDPVPPGLTVRE
jgi:hypothetical protein